MIGRASARDDRARESAMSPSTPRAPHPHPACPIDRRKHRTNRAQTADADAERNARSFRWWNLQKHTGGWSGTGQDNHARGDKKKAIKVKLATARGHPMIGCDPEEKVAEFRLIQRWGGKKEGDPPNQPSCVAPKKNGRTRSAPAAPVNSCCFLESTAPAQRPTHAFYPRASGGGGGGGVRR